MWAVVLEHLLIFLDADATKEDRDLDVVKVLAEALVLLVDLKCQLSVCVHVCACINYVRYVQDCKKGTGIHTCEKNDTPVTFDKVVSITPHSPCMAHDQHTNLAIDRLQLL